MLSRELNRQLQGLEWLIGESDNAAGGHLEIKAHWEKYLCVLVAGFVENAHGEVFSEFTKREANASVAAYVSSVLLRVQNPKAQRFIETSRQFNPTWAQSLEAFFKENGRKDAVDGIMANRRQIAHGGNSSITIAQVKDYLKRCVEVIHFIENQCGLTEPF